MNIGDLTPSQLSMRNAKNRKEKFESEYFSSMPKNEFPHIKSDKNIFLTEDNEHSKSSRDEKSLEKSIK